MTNEEEIVEEEKRNGNAIESLGVDAQAQRSHGKTERLARSAED